ncbi:hypothetical protein CgunFtcFv8_006065 [Champsocephalus gunnari]|nr:hypothetical protein CgunFtcFv8_006065 [Champsocephalus gunnari]
MAALTLRMFLLIVHLPLVGGLAVDAISGDPVQFPETEQCRERGATLQHPVTGGSSQAVAPLEDAWKPAAGYKDRMSPKESVVSNRSSINEQGLHGLACGSEETRVHLHGITSSCCVSPGAEGGPVDPPRHHRCSGSGCTWCCVEAEGLQVTCLPRWRKTSGRRGESARHRPSCSRREWTRFISFTFIYNVFYCRCTSPSMQHFRSLGSKGF